MTDLESRIMDALKKRDVSEVVVKVEAGQLVVLAVSKKVIGKIEKPTK